MDVMSRMSEESGRPPNENGMSNRATHEYHGTYMTYRSVHDGHQMI